MARPNKEQHEQRIHTLKARVTQAELITAQQRARAAGLGTSAFVRQAVLDGQVVVSHAVSDTDTRLLTDLNRIGNNLNQIARNLNSGRRERLDLDHAIAELRGVLEQVAESYGA